MELQVVGSGPAGQRDFGDGVLEWKGRATESLRQNGLKIRA